MKVKIKKGKTCFLNKRRSNSNYFVKAARRSVLQSCHRIPPIPLQLLQSLICRVSLFVRRRVLVTMLSLQKGHVHALTVRKSEARALCNAEEDTTRSRLECRTVLRKACKTRSFGQDVEAKKGKRRARERGR